MESQKELAPKDCRVCNRRRIKCDRRAPSCAKCEKRGFTCSGYGIILKWDQGVASRGNLKGRSLPVKSAEKSTPVALAGATVPCVQSEPEEPCEEIQRSLVPFSPEIKTIPKTLLPLRLQNSNERRLLYHYDHVVASNMAWADCSENPWRHIIIPLALGSPPLMNAILAFAAKHVNAISFSASRDKNSVIPFFPDIFQQKAMMLLAREIKNFANQRASRASADMSTAISLNRSNAILATMLVLCNVETVWPDSPVWQVHLNAARTVIESSQDTPSAVTQDSTSDFLQQELFIANTFASTTNFLNFSLTADFKPDARTSKPGSIFVEFLKLLQMVTSLERQAATNPEFLCNSGVSAAGLRKLFEHARSRTLEMAKESQASGSQDYLHLSRTVNCFYHAGLIYSYRALLKSPHLDPTTSSSPERQTQLTTSKLELFHALGFAETNKPTFAQDLVWPLFIAGTEATRKEEQDMVVAKLRLAMAETGFSNCQHAVEFLGALWRKRNCVEGCGDKVDWIAFAREWTGEGRTFLVF